MPDPALAIIGIGQSLRGDDAAGLLAVEAWQAQHPGFAGHPAIRVELAENPGLGLIDSLLEIPAAILVDAILSNSVDGEPAAIYQESELRDFAAGAGSAHGLGVAEALRMGRLLEPDKMPGRVVIIGIHASRFDPGTEASGKIRTALPRIVKLIHQQVESMLGTP